MDEERKAAFRNVYEQHYGSVLAFVLRRHPREGAEDVVQETFLAVWRRFADLPEPPLPWLYGTARNVLANHRRGEMRHVALSVKIAGTGVGEESGPTERAAGDPTVHRVLAGLPEADREILALVAWEGLSPTEVAAVLGCSGATARVRLHRARRRFARALEEAETGTGATTEATPATKEGT
ncbi:MAG: RNA polymerase sigma factor [Thermoleophilia bacterium]|nr:RNA polymerase sigma factor [Thermoleophilia bacterium]